MTNVRVVGVLQEKNTAYKIRGIEGFRLAGTLLKKTVAILVLLILWEVAPQTGLADRTFLPPLSDVLKAWWQLLQSGELADHVISSLVRAWGGYFLAIAYGIPLGIAMGWYKVVSEVLNPLVETFRNTAALALFPLFILLLGIGEVSKIAIVVYACSWPILLNTIGGVKNVDPLLIKSARSMGVSHFTLFYKVILPAAVPSIFTGIRLSGATSILVLVAAEMIGAKAGLGYLIIYSQYSFQVPNMYAGIITISIIGLLVNKTLIYLEKKFTIWKPEVSI
ncbi:MAG TPA: ABC transporter permease [Methylomusa anaerophila]|uniref:Putative aliphatic sulfonates transport permease protein SsuC n=1 Tax=Methylomusa anaerophila TaxID=1930071 RepID=A0A348AEX4_9FIRM|nr:ABC transporter permease [Methylomusa anaerophila]BBB89622.1 putative aliphatic sulfonates transport permease protein SsuC [Methylomusa anaerophila]HML89605.1 ABC transporter permease [Methylomusa anaerophila]